MAQGTSTQPSARELFGDETPPKNARDRLLNKAIDLFYVHGFNAVGLDRIIAEVGVTKTTFYKHFSGKDELMVEAVKVRDARETEAWNRAVQELAGDNPREQLLSFFKVLDIWFNDVDFRGCIFINTAAEFPNPNDPVHIAAVTHKKRVRDGFRDLAVAAGLRDPEAFTDQYTILLEGALILRQIHGRNDAARVAMGTVKQLIENHSVR